MTNPSSRWFELGMRDSDLENDMEVKLWLKNAEEKIYQALNQSNFNQEIHEIYLDLGSVGTPCLYSEEDTKDDIRFFARPMDEICAAEDATGRVDTVYRKYQLEAKKAVEAWGDKAGKTAIDAYNKGEINKKIGFIHAIEPRYSYDASKPAQNENFPWASIYVCVDDKRKVDEGGYLDFPFQVPRYSKNSGDVYGYSPGMTALPDIKMLQRVSKTILKAAQKVVDPAIVLPHDGYVMPFKTGAASINYRTKGKPTDKIEILETKGNIPVGRDIQNDYRQTIRSYFFVDLFLMLMNEENMTATEVRERVAEKMFILGPVIGRLQSEILDPIITRTLNILIRRGKIPMPPQAVINNDYKVVYISPLAKAQRVS